MSRTVADLRWTQVQERNVKPIARTLESLRGFLAGRGWTSLHELRPFWGRDHAGGSKGQVLISIIHEGVVKGLLETMGGDCGTFMVRAVDASNPHTPTPTPTPAEGEKP